MRRRLLYDPTKTFHMQITKAVCQDFVVMNHIKSTLHKSHAQHLKLIMETACANWIVDAKIRIENERLKMDASNGQRRINEKIREIVRYFTPLLSSLCC